MKAVERELARTSKCPELEPASPQDVWTNTLVKTTAVHAIAGLGRMQAADKAGVLPVK